MDEAKRELVQSWLHNASHDLAAARLPGTSDPPLFGVAMYHCEQAAEKALKGYLVCCDQRPIRSHDLGRLLDQLIPIEPVFDTWRDAADRLTPLGTRYRYPGEAESPSVEDFQEALDDATALVNQAMSLLPPGVIPPAEST